MLAAAGAALGSMFAALVGPALRSIVPASIPRGDEIGVDLWILAFFAATATVVTLLAALAPAWRGTRFDVVTVLKGTSANASADPATARWRRGLVGAQTAISTALLLAAALLLASFWRLTHMPLGFEADQVVTAEMRLVSTKYAGIPPPASLKGGPPGRYLPSPALIAFQEQVLANIRALPGVVDAGLTSAVPFRGVDFVYVLSRVGAKKTTVGNARFVDPGYFSVLNVPVIHGRTFTQADTMGSPRVVVISEDYARRMFGAEDPIGQRIAGDDEWEVVGIVGDMRYKSFDSDAMPAIYFPRAQSPMELICVVARLAPGAGNLEPDIRRVIKQLDPDLPAMKITTIDQILSASVADRRFYTIATAALALLALALTIVGLIVVISRAVVERRHEMAIRAALGASSRDLIRSVARQSLMPVVIGLCAGLSAVYASATVLRQFLFHTEPRVVSLYASVALVVLLVAVCAALIPARRAAHVSPSAALRAE